MEIWDGLDCHARQGLPCQSVSVLSPGTVHQGHQENQEREPRPSLPAQGPPGRMTFTRRCLRCRAALRACTAPLGEGPLSLPAQPPWSVRPSDGEAETALSGQDHH